MSASDLLSNWIGKKIRRSFDNSLSLIISWTHDKKQMPGTCVSMFQAKCIKSFSFLFSCSFIFIPLSHLVGFWCIHLHLLCTGDGGKDGGPWNLWPSLLSGRHLEQAGFLHRHGWVSNYNNFKYGTSVWLKLPSYFSWLFYMKSSMFLKHFVVRMQHKQVWQRMCQVHIKKCRRRHINHLFH